ncbi:MAG: Baseplate-J domain-containing protein [Thermoanaerobacterium thermosaccharolyticum]
MFEDMTYENILDDMLSQVTSDVDKREGSVIYDALAPCAYKLAEQYYQLSNFIDLFFVDTAVGEYLDRKALDYGLERKEATQAIRKVETTGEIEIGTRLGLEDTTYVIIEKISDTEYKAECEQYGEEGNRYSGGLENIDNVSGVTATLTDIITSGEDEETDDNFRKRIYAYIQQPATSGNAYQYKQWALEVSGVGDAKVIPLANGPGTVKVLIVDSNMEIDETLEQTVYEYIESVRPIGAKVTVDSPKGVKIDVTADIVLDGSKTLSEVTASFTETLQDYLKSTVFRTYSISYAKIGSALLDAEGVEDYSNLLINGGVSNISISEDEIPVIGNINLMEVV